MNSKSLLTSIFEYGTAAYHASNDRVDWNFLLQGRRIWRARFKYGIGARLYSLFELQNVDESAWPDYIIDEPFKLIQRSASPVESRSVVDDKVSFYRHCQIHHLPTIPIYGVMSRQLNALYKDLPFINTADQLAALFAVEGTSLFFKLIDGSHGRKAFLATRAGDEIIASGMHFSHARFFSYCNELIQQERGWLIQPVLTNHQSMLEYMAMGLGTVRIVSLICDGTMEIAAAALRITVGASVVDNFAHGKSGNLVAAIDLESGRLREARGSRLAHWPVMKNFATHPVKGVQIVGQQLPYWLELMTVVRDAQKSMPLLKSVGWDIAITDAGPIIVEANSTYDLDLIQVAHQAGFKPWFEQRHFGV